MRFKNFKLWRGRLPHWRADDVVYYVTFKHRRELDESERNLLFRRLLKPDGHKWDIIILCVLPEQTDLIFTVREGKQGEPMELSEIAEGAIRKAGKDITKRTGERFPPFYTEPFDRIIRDEAEFEERFDAILFGPVDASLAEDPGEYECLWLSESPVFSSSS